MFDVTQFHQDPTNEVRQLFQTVLKDSSVRGLVISRNDGTIVFTTMEPEETQLAGTAALNGIRSFEQTIESLDKTGIQFAKVKTHLRSYLLLTDSKFTLICLCEQQQV